MPNYYEISATDDKVKLKDGEGAAGFTVRYVGRRPVEARVRAVAVEGAEDAWLEVEAPGTRNMEPNQTDTFTVNLKVPPGTPTGHYGLRLDAMSVDNTDEEYDQGPTVSFEVSQRPPPPPQSAFPWWIVIVAALVLTVVIGGLVWWLNRDEPDSQLPAQGVIDFRQASAGPSVPMNGWLQSLKAIPEGDYCSDAVPVVLGEGRYRLPFSALSTASPGDMNRCNGVELSFQLKRPASVVTISFFGADTAYELRAFGSSGAELGTDTANSTPYDYGEASTVTVRSQGPPIERFEFGYQTALTLITTIEIQAAGSQ